MTNLTPAPAADHGGAAALPEPLAEAAGTRPRILVIKLGALGDIVLADGAMHDLRRHPSRARIVLKPAGRVLNLCELAGVLQGAACVVGNDSGPTHLAACLGTPCVALFDARSASPVTTGIRQRRATCLLGDPLADITPQAVLAATVAQLSA